MNIFSGIYQPDRGQIYLQNKLADITSTQTAMKLGIGMMIYKHFMLVPELTVSENIILGSSYKWRLNLRKKQMKLTRIAQSYGMEIDPCAIVGNLPVGVQQRVQILKVLYRQANI